MKDMQKGYELLAAAAAAMLAIPADSGREQMNAARIAHHEFSVQMLARPNEIIPDDEKPQVMLAALQASLRVSELAEEGRISAEYVDFLWTQVGEDIEALQALVAQVPGLTASLCDCESHHPIIAREGFETGMPEGLRELLEGVFGNRGGRVYLMVGG